MDMEITAWMSLYHAMNAQEERRPFSQGDAAPDRRVRPAAPPQLVGFLVLSVGDRGAGGGHAGARRPGRRRDRRRAPAYAVVIGSPC